MALKYSDSRISGKVLNQREKLLLPMGFGNEINKLLERQLSIHAAEITLR